MAATGERDDPAFPVGAACRIDSRSPWRQIAEIPVGLDPEGIAVDLERRRAFVACSRSDFVSVVDLETHEVIGEIRTGNEPIDIASTSRRAASSPRTRTPTR
jgi:YVTN family beta-propeller protein